MESTQVARMHSRTPAGEAGSLEYPALLHVRGRSPVKAVLEQLNPTACRLRSVLLFDVGSALAFDFGAAGKAIRLSGRVAERNGNGPRFSYRVTLDALPVDVEELTIAISQWRRAGASANREAAEAAAADGLARVQTRVATQFRVAFRTREGEEVSDGRAGDLSTGGLSLSCKERLAEGRLLYLRFTLPPEGAVTADGAPQPFSEMEVQARIIWQRSLGSGIFAYGVGFLEIDAANRAEIKRYVEGVRSGSPQAELR
jgi:PilZ domain